MRPRYWIKVQVASIKINRTMPIRILLSTSEAVTDKFILQNIGSKMIKEKYTKNILLGEIGEQEKTKLLNSKVLIAGCGALGSKVLANLASAGIGTIGIIDNPENCKAEKVLSAQKWVEKNYKEINIKTYNDKIDEINSEKIIGEYNLLVDCFDNYQSKFLLNEYAVKYNIPMVHGEAAENYGHATVIIPHKTPCLECLFPNTKRDIKLSNESAGFAVNALGALMSQSAINLLLDIKDDLENVLLTYNSDEMKLEKIQLSFNPDCRVCGQKQ